MLVDIGFGLFGLLGLLAIAWLFSMGRWSVNWRLVVTGVALQMLFGVLVLKTAWGAMLFNALAEAFVTLIGFTREGASFIFGNLLNAENDSIGFIFAFQVLPTIIFFSAFMAVLYHLGVMQRVVGAMAWLISRVMPVSGSETVSVCANVFIGQTEAPLVVRPYVLGMTRSELLTLMVGGMATIAGGVMAAYVGLLGGTDPAEQVYFARHLLTASIMAAPATLVIAKILLPETETSPTAGVVNVAVERTAANVIDAAATGASDGVRLALNVGGMLLAFIALIAMINAPLEWFGNWSGLAEWLGRPLNLALILGWILAPIAWLIGVPWGDAQTVGGLIGTKVVLNEFVAYAELGKLVAAEALSDKAVLISTYALCGFANFSSIAIQIGGIGGIAPERRVDLARFGLYAVLGGSLATLMTATIAGVLQSI